jgi:alpha-galactosidase
MNQSLIAINQDPDCSAPFTVNCTTNGPESIVMARFLTNGDIALGMFNMGDVPAPVAVDFFDLGLPYRSGFELEFFDCIKEKPCGTKREMITETVGAHACRLYRCSLKKI